MKVAVGREVSINGRRYSSGADLPELPDQVALDLIARGDIERPEPKRKTKDSDE